MMRNAVKQRRLSGDPVDLRFTTMTQNVLKSMYNKTSALGRTSSFTSSTPGLATSKYLNSTLAKIGLEDQSARSLLSGRSGTGISTCKCADHHKSSTQCNDVQTAYNLQVCKYSTVGPACSFNDHCITSYAEDKSGCNGSKDCHWAAGDNCRLKCGRLESQECCNGFGTHCYWATTSCKAKCSAMLKTTCDSSNRCTWNSGLSKCTTSSTSR